MDIKRLVIVIILLISVLFPHAFAEEASGKLRIGFLPYLQPSTLLEKYQPLADHLADRLGRQVEISISKNYEAQVWNLRDGKIDIAFLGAATYVKLANGNNKPPRIIVRYEMNGVPTFQGVILVRKDAESNNLTDLNNKSMAFGDPRSTLSHLVPRDMLLQNGIDIKQLSRHGFVGSHDNVIMNVVFGQYDAGGVAEEVLAKHIDKPVRILARSEPISTHVFVAAEHLSEQEVENIRRELLNLKFSESGKHAVESIGAPITGFTTAEDKDYDSVRMLFKRLRAVGVEP